ncbi:glycosyltransferase family A protein [Flavobacterium sp.]|uniref:glycosyltransferase family 2 protein n=1 Tax=Flavobacterium sp. TaxID=239 RepID=UPI0031D58426
MNSIITISVIIPCYNSEKTIKKCLESVLAQSTTVDEIIVVDDGSTDDSVNIIRELFKKIESNVKVTLYEQRNSGPSAARNKGVYLSTSTHIAFLDSDDEWFLEHIFTIKTFLSQNLCYKMIGTKYLSIPIAFSGEVSLRKMIFKNHFFTPCIVIDKDLFLKNEGFSENMKYAEDYYLWLNIISKNKAYLLDYVGAGNIVNKKPFGDHGLSSNLLEMHKGVLYCFNNLYLNKKIDLKTYFVIKNFEKIKYFRRIILSFLYKKNNE